ncbi:MAG: hypothetical protein Q4C95_05945, partial [Planctomycetia bacterium]|nr:hypothetical protein [Planctomycetia bacterium]
SKSSGASGDKEELAFDPTAELNAYLASDDKRIEEIPGPTGPGRIVQLTGYHYHNSDDVNIKERGAEYVRQTILRNLKHGFVDLPISLERQRAGETGVDTVSMKELGIFYPIMIKPGVIDDKYRLLDPEAAAKEREKIMKSMIRVRPGSTSGGMSGGMGGMGGGMRGSRMGASMGSGMSGGGRGLPGLEQIAEGLSSDKILKLSRFDFIIQFVWQATLPSTRDTRRKLAAEAEKQETKSESGSDSATDPNAAAAPADPN